MVFSTIIYRKKKVNQASCEISFQTHSTEKKKKKTNIEHISN